MSMVGTFQTMMDARAFTKTIGSVEKSLPKNLTLAQEADILYVNENEK